MSSSPGPGTLEKSPGEQVEYRFQLQSGYENLRVLLDTTPVPEAGTVTVEANHTLLATADKKISLSQEDAALVTTYKDLLTRPNPVAVYRQLSTQAAALVDQVGLQEALRRVGTARALSYDPVEDAPALWGALKEIGESLYAQSRSARTPNGSLGRAGRLGTVNAGAVDIIYINGIWTEPLGFEFTRDKVLPPLVNEAGYGDRTLYRIGGFYNRTAKYQRPGVMEVLTCLGLQTQLRGAGQFSKLVTSRSCLSVANAAPFVGDLFESFTEIISAAFGNLPALFSEDVEKLAEEIASDLDNENRIILVVHSQGNLVAQQALSLVQETHAARLLCVGVVGIAPPTSTGWPVGLSSLKSLIIEGSISKDLLLYVPLLLHSGHLPIENGLSDIYDAELQSSWLPTWLTRNFYPIQLSAGLHLHAINESYLGYETTRTAIIRLIQEQVGAVSSRCGSTTLAILTSSLPNGILGQSYSVQLQASGGTGSYTWQLASGSLPAGLLLSTDGQITGTPTNAGTTNFSIQVNSGSQVATRPLALTVVPAPSIPTTTTIISDEPDPSDVGESVTVSYQVISAGSTPTGIVTVTASGGSESCSGSLTNGVGSCLLTLTIAGSRTLTATYGSNDTFAGSLAIEAHMVRSEPGGPSASTSTVNASPTTITAGSGTSTITVTVKDAVGTLLSGIQVSVSATGSGNTIEPSSATSNASGVATFIFASTVAETKTITATAGGMTLVQQPMITVQAPPPPPSTGRITFSTDRDGNSEIYTMNADGTDQRNRSNNGAADYSPTWSPDGSKIAFVTDRFDPTSIPDIYVLEITTGVQTKITFNDSLAEIGAEVDPHDLAWSHDGTRIAFAEGLEIYVMDMNGTNRRSLTLDLPNDSYEHPAWSPHDMEIAFSNGLDILVINADGTGVPRNLTESYRNQSPRIEFSRHPTWSPDGLRIAFSTFFHDESNAYEEIATIRTDGTELRHLNSQGKGGTRPTWSPHGLKIAFQRGADGNLDIFVMDANDTVLERLTNNGSILDGDPEWRP